MGHRVTGFSIPAVPGPLEPGNQVTRSPGNRVTRAPQNQETYPTVPGRAWRANIPVHPGLRTHTRLREPRWNVSGTRGFISIKPETWLRFQVDFYLQKDGSAGAGLCPRNWDRCWDGYRDGYWDRRTLFLAAQAKPSRMQWQAAQVFYIIGQHRPSAGGVGSVGLPASGAAWPYEQSRSAASVGKPRNQAKRAEHKNLDAQMPGMEAFVMEIDGLARSGPAGCATVLAYGRSPLEQTPRATVLASVHLLEYAQHMTGHDLRYVLVLAGHTLVCALPPAFRLVQYTSLPMRLANKVT